MSAKKLFEESKTEIKQRVNQLKKGNITPGLAAIITENDPTAKLYVSLKMRDCLEVGIHSECIEIYNQPPEQREDILIRTIRKLNIRDDINGILVQKPLPAYVNENRVFNFLDPRKDVDGLTPYNKGILMSDYDIDKDLLPCTAVGVVKLLDHYEIDVEGMFAVIVGRSDLVGRPLRILLEKKNATVICAHTKTKNKEKLLKKTDLVVTAAGRPPELYDTNSFRLTSDLIRNGAVVVNVGVRKSQTDGKLYFDIPNESDADYQAIQEKAYALSPPLGSTGIMTRRHLIFNTLNATEKFKKTGIYDERRGYREY
ncbi:bifunctional 5,10-methylenetetrahydrofolate dehydrogenase/5,10-methenyltetrahydrofolate cyclohydrolase [[Eubacterium] cellulosolvens]